MSSFVTLYAHYLNRPNLFNTYSQNYNKDIGPTSQSLSIQIMDIYSVNSQTQILSLQLIIGNVSPLLATYVLGNYSLDSNVCQFVGPTFQGRILFNSAQTALLSYYSNDGKTIILSELYKA